MDRYHKLLAKAAAGSMNAVEKRELKVLSDQRIKRLAFKRRNSFNYEWNLKEDEITQSKF